MSPVLEVYTAGRLVVSSRQLVACPVPSVILSIVFKHVIYNIGLDVQVKT